MSQRYSIDLDTPAEPSEEQWAKHPNSERRGVIDALPSEVPLTLYRPEGDRQRKAKSGAVDALEGFFKHIGKKIYVSSDLSVYYPDEPRFWPDVFVVLDAEPGDRDRWVVADEGKGIDFILEVHVSIRYKKDFEANRMHYASLGISEYFLLDRTKDRLFGWRLSSPSACVYEPILPQLGKLRSSVLDMELELDEGRLRFYYGRALLPESRDLIGKLEKMVDSLVEQRDVESREIDVEREMREHAELKWEQAEQERDEALGKVAALEAKLAALRAIP